MHNAGGLLGPRGLAVPLAAEYEYDSTSGSRMVARGAPDLERLQVIAYEEENSEADRWMEN